jgi:hypothetical protein
MPDMAVTDDALCLQDDGKHPGISQAATLGDAVAAACLELCQGRPDLLVHAFWAPKDGAALRPLGKLFGEEAINHGDLAGTLFRMGREGTAFTSAVLRLGRPVWTSSIPRFGWRGLAAVLRAHGIHSGGAFPIPVGARIGAVIEVLSTDQLKCDLASEALVAELAPQIEERFQLDVVAAEAATDLENTFRLRAR